MPKKLLIILPTLRAGGAERVLSFIAQNIDKNEFNTHLLVLGKSEEAAYDLGNSNFTFLNRTRVLTAIPQVINFIIKFKPKVVFSSISHLNIIMALISPFFGKIKFYAREASVVSEMQKQFKSDFSLHEFLANLSYRWLDGIICQSEDMAIDFLNRYKIKKEKLFIINNPITQIIPLKKEVKSKNLNLVTVGRLSKEKGHLRILKVLNKLNRPFKYTIIGDGPMLEGIKICIEEYGLGENVNFVKFTYEVYSFLKSNDLFLQGSYVEGFPNAVLESCSVGTPVLAFTAPGGTKEIIENEINGWIVSSEKEFLERLENFVSPSPEQISASVYNKFSSDKILNKYVSLFNN